MSVVLFKDVTTEDIIANLEEVGKKYTGLYVDMNNAPERKYVKDQAETITKMLKALDRARIDKAKDFKVSVEKEAASIKERLEEANRPFTLLIDLHKAERKKILDEQKRIEDEKAMAIEKERDHEYALLMDAKVMADKAEAIREQQARDEIIASEAAKEAVERERRDREFEEAKIRRGNEQRASDTAQKAKINNEILSALMQEADLDEVKAKAVITAIYNSQIPNVRINY